MASGDTEHSSKRPYALMDDSELALATVEADREASRWSERAAQARLAYQEQQKEVNRLQTEINRIEQEVTAAKDKSIALRFEALLKRLQRNDPNVTTVDLTIPKPDAFPRGYATALGQALHCNTNVTTLVVDLLHLVSLHGLCSREGTSTEMEPLLVYLKDPSNQLVHVRAQCNRSFYEEHILACLILNAISQCAHLKRLTWNCVAVSPEALSNVLSLNTLPLRDLNIAFPKPRYAYSVEDNRAIAAAFRSNTTLEKLTLNVASVFGQWSLLNDILSALQGAAAEANLANNGNVFAMEERNKRYGLRDLHVINYGLGPPETLADYLRVASATTGTLQRLTLEGCVFDHQNGMMPLLASFGHGTGNDEKSTTSASRHPIVPAIRCGLTALAFVSCTFLRNAATELALFLQTEACCYDGDEQGTTTTAAAVVPRTSCLRELHISPPSAVYYYGSLCDIMAYSALAKAMLMAKHAIVPAADSDVVGDDSTRELGRHCRPERLIHTIGSQIQRLSLTRVQPRFLRQWRGRANRCRFQRLELLELSEKACKMLSKCMPHFLFLEQLKVTTLETASVQVVLPVLCSGLKKNGSIGTVDFGRVIDDDKSAFVVSRLRLVNAYCQRNRMLSQLIASQSCTGNRGAESRSCGCSKEATSMADDEAVQAGLHFLPLMLQAANPMPTSIRLNVTMSGLRNLSP